MLREAEERAINPLLSFADSIVAPTSTGSITAFRNQHVSPAHFCTGAPTCDSYVRGAAALE